MKITIEFDDPEMAARVLMNFCTAETPMPVRASAPAPSAPPPGNAPAAPPPSAPPASAPASAPPSAPPPAPAPSAPPPPPAAPSGQPTQADLSAHIQAYSKAGSAKATKAKLAEMGFASVGAIPPEHYAYVIQHMPLA